jgi:hypothetical protein
MVDILRILWPVNHILVGSVKGTVRIFECRATWLRRANPVMLVTSQYQMDFGTLK